MPSLLRRLPVKLVNRGRHTHLVYLFAGARLSTHFLIAIPFALWGLNFMRRTNVWYARSLTSGGAVWMYRCKAAADSNHAICFRLYFLRHMAWYTKSVQDMYIPGCLRKPSFSLTVPQLSILSWCKERLQSLISCENEFSIFPSLSFFVSCLWCLICLVVLCTDSINEQGDCTSWAGIPSSFPRRYERNKSCRLSQ